MLSETGVVGGVLFVGALVLGLGGMLWPRFRAGWDGLRRNPQPGRWGADPRLYAWETMLAIGVLYWMIHGSGEWLWNIPGVSLPAVLMLALGVASVDARGRRALAPAARVDGGAAGQRVAGPAGTSRSHLCRPARSASGSGGCSSRRRRSPSSHSRSPT